MPSTSSPTPWALAIPVAAAPDPAAPNPPPAPQTGTSWGPLKAVAPLAPHHSSRLPVVVPQAHHRWEQHLHPCKREPVENKQTKKTLITPKYPKLHTSLSLWPACCPHPCRNADAIPSRSRPPCPPPAAPNAWPGVLGSRFTWYSSHLQCCPYLLLLHVPPSMSGDSPW